MIYLGTSGFKYEDWKGTFYPAGLSEREWLPFYASHFDSLEINSTYYQLLHPATFYRMGQKVPEGFLFTVKAYRTLTHEIGPGSEADLAAFLESIRPLRDSGKLGCLIAQFPNSFRANSDTRSYLAHLRQSCGDLPLAVEFRHRGWANAEAIDFLRREGMAFVCVDEPKLPTLMPPLAVATAEFGYIRFHGRNAGTWWRSKEAKQRYDYLYSEEELREWLPKIKGLSSQVGRVYLFMNNHPRAQAVANALELKGMLGDQVRQISPGTVTRPAIQGNLPMRFST